MIDSRSVGDAGCFLSFETLEARRQALPPAPRDSGTLTRIMTRGPSGVRQLLDETTLTAHGGVPGDAWGRSRSPDPEAQLAVMQEDIARLIANGQPLELSGDNLWLDLDLSAANLPAGTRLAVGDAVLESTPLPHDGCKKFRARFGADALKFVATPPLRPLNLRGIYLRVVQDGRVRVGDTVRKLPQAM
jgi:MOSC domain-containing protein YiiM